MKAESSGHNRSIVFIIVAMIHAAAIFFIAFGVESVSVPAQAAEVMKLIDIDESRPPPPPQQTPVMQNVTESVAENLLETDIVPDTVSVSAVITPPVVPAEEYVSQSKVSVTPRFNEREILSKLAYPAIAQRSGIEEGRVMLELFINKNGEVTKINILKEEPPGRGFGEAAVRAFTGIRAAPAEANGQVVAVRYRYPVRFQLK